MCSHESVTWKITDNSVTNRQIDNSLVHKFNSHRKIRKRTKVLNAEIKKHCMNDYKHYVELKTNVLRNLVNDTDTSDSSSLTDVDYDIIYSSPSKQAKYVKKNSKRYIFTSEEDCEGCKRKTVEYQMKNRGNSTKKRTQKSQRTNVVPEKHINIDWQETVRKNNTPYYLRKQVCSKVLDNEENVLKDNDCNRLKAQCSKRSLSPQLDSRNSTASETMKYRNDYVGQNHEKSNAMDNKRSKNNTISDKTKPISEKRAENHKNQNAIISESNTKFNSHDSRYQLSQSISSENSNDFNKQSNTFIELKDNNSNKLTIISNESSINTENYDDTCVSLKSELLKNVRRNLISALEKADSVINNEDSETNKNLKDSSNYDQSLSAAISFNQHSTPLKKIEINILPEINDLSPNISSPDQQKDSGIDDDSQDKFVKIKRSNKIAKCNMKNTEKMPIFSPNVKKIGEVIEAEDSKKDEKEAHLKFSNDILRDQINKEEKKLSEEEEEIKNSSQLNQIDRDIERNHKEEDKKDEQFTKTKDSNDIQKQQLLSPKQDMKDHSEPYSYVQEEEADRKVKEASEEEEIYLQLNKIDVDTEAFSINPEDKTCFKKLEDSYDIQKQQLLFPEESHIKDIHLKSYNILSKDERQVNEEKEEKNFSKLNKADKDDVKIHLINQEDKTCVKLMGSHDTQNQQVLPKIMCSEILNKKYKIIDKKDSDAKNNIETMTNINNNNTDIANEHTSIKKNTLMHCPDIIDHNTDDWQEAAINSDKTAPVTSGTDNEEININYMSPQIKKRLQQQARLNLVVNSDSSESDDGYMTTKTSEYGTQASAKSYSSTPLNTSCHYRPCSVSNYK